MNDWQLSQWISSALSGELDQQQQAELENALHRSTASKAFAEWSSRIQEAARRAGSDESIELDPFSSDRLTDVAKERMRRAILAAQNQWETDKQYPLHLSVAQAPVSYALNNLPNSSPQVPLPSTTVDTPNSTPEGPLPNDNVPYESLLLSRAALLRERLRVQLGQLAQAIQLIGEFVSLSSMFDAKTTSLSSKSTAEPTPDSRLSAVQLAALVEAMLKVDSQLSGVSIASLHDQQFVEAMRIQRNPRNADEIRVVPIERLRRGAASVFHLAIIASPASSILSTVDNSIAGWGRFVLGIPLWIEPKAVTPTEKSSPSARQVVVTAEIDLGRSLHSHISALGISEQVLLTDSRDHILFSTSAKGANEESDQDRLATLTAMSTELPAGDDAAFCGAGVAVLKLACPAPQESLKLVLIGSTGN